MKISLGFLCMGFFLIAQLSAQSPKNSPYQWAKVPNEHFELQTCPFDESADALVLSDYGHWRFKSRGKGLGFIAILERHVRIKILSENGLQYADQSLSYISEGKLEKIKGFSAQTINLVDGFPVIEELQKENIFELENELITDLQFTFPKAKIGSILEWTYTFQTQNILTLEPWIYQWDIPVLRSEIGIDPVKSLEHLYIHQNINLEKEDKQWVVYNIPALIEEPFVYDPEQYRMQTKFQIYKYDKVRSSGTYSYHVKMDLFNTWPELNRHFNKEILYYWETNEGADLIINTVDSLVSALDSTQEKERVKRIYNFVRDSIEWDGSYSTDIKGTTPGYILKTRQGNSVQINLLLANMLSSAGIPSQPAVMSLRSIGPPNTDVPNVMQFNHVVCVSSWGEQNHLYNAIDSLRPYDLPDPEDLNYLAWIVQDEGAGWMRIPDKYHSVERFYGIIDMNDKGLLSGNIKEVYKGYAALDLRRAALKAEKNGESDFWQEQYTSEYVATSCDSIKVKNLYNPDKILGVNYQFSSEDFSNQSGEFIYIDPMLIFGQGDNPFLEPKRSYPIDFHYLHRREFSFMFNIPDGYEVESIPEKTTVSLSDRTMTFRYDVQHLGKVVQIQFLYETHASVFEPDHYPMLRQLYDHMIAKQGEQIVLRRSE
ncbi:MAG: transglutaminase domain-containing protein [Bacteroidia bacterium]